MELALSVRRAISGTQDGRAQFFHPPTNIPPRGRWPWGFQPIMMLPAVFGPAKVPEKPTRTHS